MYAPAPMASPSRVVTAGLLLPSAFTALTFWSWRKWPDVQLDFGRELYFAWRLVEGEALYRDLADKNGPLSHAVNALWMRLGGVSLTSVVVGNLAVLAAVTLLARSFVERATDRGTALLAAVVLLGGFGFGQYVLVGNYNFVCPYNAYQTHGLLLGIVALSAAEALVRTGRARWGAALGAALGLAFLTKAELFVPAAVVAGTGLLLARASRPGAASGRVYAAFAAGTIAPPFVAFLWLAARMPADLAARGVLGNLLHLGSSTLADPFYRRAMGLDAPVANLTAALVATAAVAAVAFAGAGIGRVAARGGPPSRALCLGAGVLAFAVAALATPSAPWFATARALPLVCLAVAVGAAWRVGTGRGSSRAVAFLLWSLYALALLGKIALAARFQQYGFVLALPATLLLVALLVGVLPERLAGGGAGAPLHRAVMIGLVLAGVFTLLRVSDAWYARKTVPVGRGGDAILALPPSVDPRGAVVAQALDALATLVPADATLLVLPEGAGVNYWLRRRNPTRFTNFTPEEIAAAGGEDAVLAALRAGHPDFVLLLPRDGQEFGLGEFGRDPRWGARIGAWVEATYQRVTTITAPGASAGAVILRRSDPSATPRSPGS